MAALNFYGFISKTRVTISSDLSSPASKISPSVAHALDLAAIFTESGHLTCATTLVIPTLGGYYSSRLDLTIGYNLLANVVLGADWVLPCQPTFNEDNTTLQQPHPSFVDSLPSLHNWYPVAGASVTFSYS